MTITDCRSNWTQKEKRHSRNSFREKSKKSCETRIQLWQIRMDIENYLYFTIGEEDNIYANSVWYLLYLRLALGLLFSCSCFNSTILISQSDESVFQELPLAFAVTWTFTALTIQKRLAYPITVSLRTPFLKDGLFPGTNSANWLHLKLEHSRIHNQWLTQLVERCR